MSATGRVPVDARAALTADPARLRWTEHGIDRCSLGRGGEGADDVEVHDPSVVARAWSDETRRATGAAGRERVWLDQASAIAAKEIRKPSASSG